MWNWRLQRSRIIGAYKTDILNGVYQSLSDSVPELVYSMACQVEIPDTHEKLSLNDAKQITKETLIEYCKIITNFKKKQI